MLELLLFLGREQYCEGSFLSTHSDNSLPQIRPPFHGGGTKHGFMKATTLPYILPCSFSLLCGYYEKLDGFVKVLVTSC